MKKKILLACSLMYGSILFSQAPQTSDLFFNTDSPTTVSFSFPVDDYIIAPPEGLDYSSLDLDIYVPGIQHFVSYIDWVQNEYRLTYDPFTKFITYSYIGSGCVSSGYSWNYSINSVNGVPSTPAGGSGESWIYVGISQFSFPPSLFDDILSVNQGANAIIYPTSNDYLGPNLLNGQTNINYFNSSTNPSFWINNDLTLNFSPDMTFTGLATINYTYENACGISNVGLISIDVLPNSANYEELSSNPIAISPNPVSENLNINSDKKIDLIEVYDLNGKILLTSTNEKNIPISNLYPGVYLISISSDKQVFTKRFMKN